VSITWRIKVYDEGFTSRTQPGKANNILTPADAFASLDSFDVEGSGNCLEARFRCVPSLVDIRPRDVIELEVSEDGGSSYTRVYRGYIVVAGNARSTEIEAYKAVGLKQRFYDKVNTMSVVDGDDIATMASYVHSQLITDSYLPGGVASLSADAPTLSLVLGNRYPQLESVGETYDALAEQAGAFIVASGTTYTYDGVTYEAGETVPAVQWGVDADGNLFFKRWQRDALVAAEDDDDKFVRYNDVAAEKVYDSVELVYAAQDQVPFSGETLVFFPATNNRKVLLQNVVLTPLSRRFDFGGDENSTLRVLAADPLAVMLEETLSISSEFGVTSSSNAFDGDDATYATFSGSGGQIVFTTPSVPDGGILRCIFQVTSATNEFIIDAGDNNIFYENVDTGSREFITPILPGHSLIDGDAFDVGSPWQIIGTNIRLYSFEFYVPAVDNSGSADSVFARNFLTSVNTDVAEVSQFGSLGLVSQTMSFTPAGESAVSVPVERVSYSLSTREGLVTTYHLGQAYDAELLSERAVLEALAQRVSS